MTAEYATVDGSRVWYRTSGSGQVALVLVHGWTCDSSFWRFQEPLSKQFRVVALDLPGHGKSDKPETDYTMERFARAVAAVMDAAGVKKAVLAGHSMGSPVIRHVLKLYPARVAALISVDGAIFRFENTDSMMQWARSLDSAAAREKMAQGMFTDATTPELRKEILEKMLATPQRVASSAMTNLVASRIWFDPPASVPALALNMQRKQQPGARKTLEEVFTNLDYREFEGLSHFLHMEKPEEINRAIAAFVQKVPR